MEIKLEVPLGAKELYFLRNKLKILSIDESIDTVERAGAGNMNMVLRVRTNHRQLILKQSRPYVNKYPEIPAPFHRMSIEKAFYDTLLTDNRLVEMTPSLIAFDDEHQVLAMEDLGPSADFAAIYQTPSLLRRSDIEPLAVFLKRLHAVSAEAFPTNEAMKLLNHAHIFEIPFMLENGLNLDQVQPGLEEISLPYRKDTILKDQIRTTGNRYLQQGRTLLHGDFYPGSWLKTADGIRIIDTEFAFMGDREFDLGVALAHLKLAGVDQDLLNYFLEVYDTVGIDDTLMHRYAGIEILRRLFGVAQLPLHLTLEKKQVLAQEAKNNILHA
ncbi:MAG: phosphotransferase [Lunatimonas sp.]|uniref:phosphotransferase n=1 Tax=Lunatimonas sp. TaxID=2060141 RepID=UPI00263AEAF1|nr:phosphotransferase [Lunatimonas sp.]MCC5938794.1 phosphotransferase [Lunatimonas sp.]